MKIDLTALVEAIVALLAALVTGYIIPLVKSNTPANQQSTLIRAVQLAVGAAEQLYGSKMGQEKKKYVLDYLKGKGFKIDDTLIEGTVNEIFGTITPQNCEIKRFVDTTKTEG